MFLGFNGRGFGQGAADEVDVGDLDALQSTHRLIDVRGSDEFLGMLGHIPGSENQPLDQLASRAHDWDRSQPLVLICQSGGRSARAVDLLKRMGFEGAVNLRGGMMAYQVWRSRAAA